LVQSAGGGRRPLLKAGGGEDVGNCFLAVDGHDVDAVAEAILLNSGD